MPITIGCRVGKYRVTGLLGSGGMGAVYTAIHETIGQRAAVKVLHAQFSQDPALAHRFLNEARAVSTVDHAGLVKIFDSGHLEDGTLYILMEHLGGESLATRLSRVRRLAPADAVRLGRQIASGLVAAHGHGIVHRDLKPANVMIVADPETPGGERTKLLDFGIAKVQATTPGGGPVTSTGAVMGTPMYMAPEQCHGARDVTSQADVYALGVILFEMLAGRPPFVADGVGALIGMHLFHEPPALQPLVPEISPELAALVGRLLRKDPAQRPAMSQVVAALDALRGGGAASEAPPPPSPAPRSPPSTLGGAAGQLAPPASRWSLGAVLLGGALLVGGGGAALRATRSASAPDSGASVRAVAAAPVRPVATRAVTAPPVAASSAPAPPVPRPAAVCQVDSVPGGAAVRRVADGQLLGLTPLRWAQPAAAQDVELLVSLRPRYADQRVFVTPGEECRASLQMKPVGTGRARHQRGAAAPPAQGEKNPGRQPDEGAEDETVPILR